MNTLHKQIALPKCNETNLEKTIATPVWDSATTASYCKNTGSWEPLGRNGETVLTLPAEIILFGPSGIASNVQPFLNESTPEKNLAAFLGIWGLSLPSEKNTLCFLLKELPGIPHTDRVVFEISWECGDLKIDLDHIHMNAQGKWTPSGTDLTIFTNEIELLKKGPIDTHFKAGILLEIALNFLKLLGSKNVELTDGSYINFGMHDVSLKLLRALDGKKTLYQDWGFEGPTHLRNAFEFIRNVSFRDLLAFITCDPAFRYKNHVIKDLHSFKEKHKMSVASQVQKGFLVGASRLLPQRGQELSKSSLETATFKLFHAIDSWGSSYNPKSTTPAFSIAKIYAYELSISCESPFNLNLSAPLPQKYLKSPEPSHHTNQNISPTQKEEKN